jgi:farnesyl-diphosphate farnesyltransferase
MPPTSLLREVSRSFYLSIRLLPPGLREPVGLAYLLARATDTIADTVGPPAGQRLHLLGRIASAIQGTPQPGLQEEADAFSRVQAHPGERRLMARLVECIAELERLTEADRADVRTVLGHIVRGQVLDVARPHITDAAALHEYTYLVAGSVGEFWTDMCARHVQDFATLPHDEMRLLGREFGCALQLVNIVRDAGEDARAGRSYLPPGDDWQRWREAASSGLDSGMAYALAVNSRRIRAAVALPALIGKRTIALLREAGPRGLETKVKVARSEVRALLLRIGLRLASREALQAEWENPGR